MSAHIPRLSGEEWQDWANKLLTCHYGPTEYQRVPDNDRGDAGIEGFTLSNGHAYQAYGCEEPLSTSERHAKQRDKMTGRHRQIHQEAVVSTRDARRHHAGWLVRHELHSLPCFENYTPYVIPSEPNRLATSLSLTLKRPVTSTVASQAEASVRLGHMSPHERTVIQLPYHCSIRPGF